MFASVTAKVVAAACALIGAIALLGTFLLNVGEGCHMWSLRWPWSSSRCS